jgi:hypothetical protein
MRSSMSTLKTMSTRACAVVVLVVTLLVNLGCGASRPATFWTVTQAESIKRVRGTALNRTACTGLGDRRVSAYQSFSCAGVVVPRSAPQLPVRVRYVLNPRGKYMGQTSAYLATNVHFDSFGVP